MLIGYASGYWRSSAYRVFCIRYKVLIRRAMEGNHLFLFASDTPRDGEGGGSGNRSHPLLRLRQRRTMRGHDGWPEAPSVAALRLAGGCRMRSFNSKSRCLSGGFQDCILEPLSSPYATCFGVGHETAQPEEPRPSRPIWTTRASRIRSVS